MYNPMHKHIFLLQMENENIVNISCLHVCNQTEEFFKGSLK